jgi:hypothetical protein
MKKEIPITKDNEVYAYVKLLFTHDYSAVKVGSIMIDRHGNCNEVTKINKDECGRRRFWSFDKCLCVQYTSPHNMLTKLPFYAHQYELTHNPNN